MRTRTLDDKLWLTLDGWYPGLAKLPGTRFGEVSRMTLSILIKHQTLTPPKPLIALPILPFE
jgi:hypothetical protein